jgi:carboxyl-terminal processing protease
MVRASRAIVVGIFVSTLVAAIAFVGGVAAALRWGSSLPLVATLSPISAAQTVAPASAADDFGVFWEVWRLVDQKFYHQQPLDYQRMTYGAIEGMLKSLDDDYTVFEAPEDAEKTRERMSGQIEGIGAYIEFKDGRLLIVAPIEESPAEKAGILAGDEVLKIDGQPLAPQLDGLDATAASTKAATLIRGEQGTTVTLTIFRSASNETRDYAIVRDAVPLISVRGKLLEGQIAYIQLSSFNATTTAELDKALNELLPQQPKGVILDLRNNPGGLLNVAQETLGRFLPGGIALKEQLNDGQTRELEVIRSASAPQVFDLPLLVLTNGGSASASEVVAGALRDRGRATLIGEKSFGKGSVQSVERLSDGSSARITIAHYLTPDGHEVHKIGLEPALYVPFVAEEQYRVTLPQRRPTDPATVDDSQLWWALRTLIDNERPSFPTPTATPVASPTP